MVKWRKSKPYGCPICERDFDKESQLRKHMKDKHGIDMVKTKQLTKEQ